MIMDSWIIEKYFENYIIFFIPIGSMKPKQAKLIKFVVKIRRS